MATTESFDWDRLYAFRHRHVAQGKRQAVWDEISPFLFRMLGEPVTVLDPAAGRGEFISAVPSPERWVVDAVDYDDARYPTDVKVVIGDILSVDLPIDHFDAVFASNLLEHFASQPEVGRFLRRMYQAMAPGGRIGIMGPNFKYAMREYFDCADHTLALTHLAVEEHLHTAGFGIRRVVPRFLPYSFRGSLPASRALVRGYLRLPAAWRILGKQFLVIGEKPRS
jgi:SAM-dependent methyltransferase